MEVRYASPSPSELFHHGIKGQKWGIRRYQNPDGSLTSEGKARIKSFKQNEIRIIRKKFNTKKEKYKTKISNTDDEVKRKRLQEKIKNARIRADNEINVIRNYTLKDIRREQIAVGAEVATKSILAIGTFAVPLIPDVIGAGLLASTYDAKQRYRLKGV